MAGRSRQGGAGYGADGNEGMIMARGAVLTGGTRSRGSEAVRPKGRRGGWWEVNRGTGGMKEPKVGCMRA